MSDNENNVQDNTELNINIEHEHNTQKKPT